MMKALTNTRELQATTAAIPTYRRFQQRALALCILLAPLTLTVYLMSWLHINVSGTMLAYSQSVAALGTPTNQVHIAFGILAAIFLPLGFLGMALLGMKRSPWLATFAAIFGLIGWAPFAGIVSIDILLYEIARLGSAPQLVALWTQFNSDGPIMALQYIYIIGHMVGAVLLGILLSRTRQIPNWAGIAFLLSSPVTMVLFAIHQVPQLVWIVCALFLIGAIPAALAMWQGKSEEK